MSEFNQMLKDFEKNSGIAPSPGPIKQSDIEKQTKEEQKKVDSLQDLVTKLELMAEINLHDAKIEFFTVDFMLSQIPEPYRPKKLLDRITRLAAKIHQAEHTHTLKQIDNQHQAHKVASQLPPAVMTFDDVKPLVGLQSDEERLMETVERDEHLQAEEEDFVHKLKPPVSVPEDPDEDLDKLQVLEKKETAQVKKEAKERDIETVSKTVDIAQKKEPHKIRVVHTSPINPLHAPGSNLIFGKTLPRQLSATELYENGMEYFNHKEYEKAIECFKHALVRAPNNMAVRIRLAETLQKINQGG